MKSNEELKLEQQEIKVKLAELVDFINSEEYYTLSENEKGLVNKQRTGMEIYLSSLTKRIYDEEGMSDSSSMLWLSLLMGMFGTPWGLSLPKIPESPKTSLEEQDFEAKGVVV